MGVFLGQLPPAEIARLKAELAETLIAHFCYPRFYDYRTNSLRTRPVDRTKRQEVWLYLSSVDFTSWNRVDLMSSDFQHQIERLFIHFVQRNRSFFGEQGRKRMSDIRMLIGSSALAVTQGLRGHLTGHHQNNPPFGSPRPVSSWSTSNVVGRTEPSWEQLAQQTMVLQQQLQEMRGEIKSTSVAPPTEGRPTQAAPQRVTRVPSTPITHIPPTPVPTQQSVTANRARNGESAPAAVGSMQAMKTSQPVEVHSNGATNVPSAPVTATKSVSSSNPELTRNAVSAMASALHAKIEPPVYSVAPVAPVAPVAQNTSATPMVSAELPTAPVAIVMAPVKQTIAPLPQVSIPESVQQVQHVSPPNPQVGSSPVPQQVHTSTATPSTQTTQPTQSLSTTPATTVPAQRENTALLASEEDVAIFEQMRYQLVVWLRVEAVHAGLDISNQGPMQLLDLLRQQEKRDESRLQVISTMLNLCNQVMRNGKANLYDYKQALMFHLMHTKR